MSAGGGVEYSEDLALDICTCVAGGMSLTRTLKRPNMPTLTSVYRWIADKPAFKEMLERARTDQADSLADQIRDAADTLEALATDTEKPPLAAQVQAHKVRLDALIWTASKLKPKKYSERQQVDITESSYLDLLQAIADKEQKASKRTPKVKTTRAIPLTSDEEVGDPPSTTH